jgi:hypothetical protein
VADSGQYQQEPGDHRAQRNKAYLVFWQLRDPCKGCAPQARRSKRQQALDDQDQAERQENGIKQFDPLGTDENGLPELLAFRRSSTRAWPLQILEEIGRGIDDHDVVPVTKGGPIGLETAVELRKLRILSEGAGIE